MNWLMGTNILAVLIRWKQHFTSVVWKLSVLTVLSIWRLNVCTVLMGMNVLAVLIRKIQNFNSVTWGLNVLTMFSTTKYWNVLSSSLNPETSNPV